jgi:hypothetical protein
VRAKEIFDYFQESLDFGFYCVYISGCFDGHLWAKMKYKKMKDEMGREKEKGIGFMGKLVPL